MVIVGKETHYANEIKQYITDNEIINKVVFLNGLDLKELAILYRNAQIFVYPSIYEGFGIPIIEAMYSKTAVITTSGGVFIEAAGPDAVYVDSDNVKQMENAINLLLTNKSLRNEIAKKGFEYVQQFNDELFTSKYISIYKSLID